MTTIFISIAAYKDKLLPITINEAYSKAKHKDNLVFGIFEQNTEADSINLNNFEFNSQIRYSRIDPELTKGVCWARKNVQDMFQNEAYYFQIDAHTLFDQDWDEYFINNLKELKKYHNKPIITAYPATFDQDTFERVKYESGTVAIVATDDDHGRKESFIRLGYSPPWGNPNYPAKHQIVHGYHLGACCIFTEGDFVKDVPYDESVFFGGEEPILTIRAWTRGYNIFHLGNIRVYHCWGKNYGGIVLRDIRAEDSKSYVLQAKDYIRQMINGEIMGQYGLGNSRTIQQYIEYSGLDLFNCKYHVRELMFTKPYYEQLNI
jgi:hypothetical protein